MSIDKILQDLKTSCQKYGVPPPSVSFSLLAMLKGILCLVLVVVVVLCVCVRARVSGCVFFFLLFFKLIFYLFLFLFIYFSPLPKFRLPTFGVT